MTLMDGQSLQSTSLIQPSEFLTSQGHKHEMEQSITDSQAPKARKEAMWTETNPQLGQSRLLICLTSDG
jgi:hypothetical protein